MAARIDPTSAERGGREPRNTRSNCRRKTSSAKGRENVRVPVKLFVTVVVKTLERAQLSDIDVALKVTATGGVNAPPFAFNAGVVDADATLICNVGKVDDEDGAAIVTAP